MCVVKEEHGHICKEEKMSLLASLLKHWLNSNIENENSEFINLLRKTYGRKGVEEEYVKNIQSFLIESTKDYESEGVSKVSLNSIVLNTTALVPDLFFIYNGIFHLLEVKVAKTLNNLLFGFQSQKINEELAKYIYENFLEEFKKNECFAKIKGKEYISQSILADIVKYKCIDIRTIIPHYLENFHLVVLGLLVSKKECLNESLINLLYEVIEGIYRKKEIVTDLKVENLHICTEKREINTKDDKSLSLILSAIIIDLKLSCENETQKQEVPQ